MLRLGKQMDRYRFLLENREMVYNIGKLDWF